MVEWVTVPAIKPDDLSWISMILIVEGEDYIPSVVLQPPRMNHDMCMPPFHT